MLTEIRMTSWALFGLRPFNLKPHIEILGTRDNYLSRVPRVNYSLNACYIIITSFRREHDTPGPVLLEHK